MNCEDLTPEQLEQLKDQVRRTIRYFQALRARMEQRGFPYDDELRQKVSFVCDAAHSLWVSLHYLSCGSGTGRSPKRTSGEPRTGPTTYRIQFVLDPSTPFPAVE